ncbi:type I restriction endonuclease subunit R [Faecalibaculum rodentium]|uniref:type I restriction endonuclease subunit R n=4 Tax=Faecalibaculum rodentium TaxID=1702221 RepID=UPI001C3E6FCD|nr:HsdR family type I site-specific deoxyribonuclease [Faecalibaculum rodentium]
MNSNHMKSEAQFEAELIEKLSNSPLSTEEDRKRSSHIYRSRNWTYEPQIKTTDQLWQNFKEILESHNQQTLDRPLSYTEFAQVKREIESLTTPFKAGQFLYGMNGVSQVEVDLDDGRHVYLTVFDQSQVGAGSTVYQVVNQIERPAVISGKPMRRFDVTLLINGLPIIQIELKRADVTVERALNQMQQYTEENQYSGIFSTVQILVAMSECNTRYMARTTPGNFNKEFAFHWQFFDNNNVVRRWNEFTDTFLSIPMAHNMATNYMILDGTVNKETLKVMRPYQVAATQRVLDAIKGNDFSGGLGKLGYVWHTTGSGKTITSFKTAWLASKLPTVDKVVFLVDRKALTSQTRDNYRAYDPEGFGDTSSIEDTANTNELSRKLKAKDNNIIVTSVQKLERLASRKNFKAPDRNFVFIVDEAHRSTGGQAFEKIQKAFKKSAWIGYTGTPIFTDTKEKDSTPQVFGNNLHTYTIREAIADKNVLGFKVDFMTTLASDAVKTKYLPDFFRNQHPNWSEEKIQDKIDNLTDDDMDDMVAPSFYDENPRHVEAVVDNIYKNWKNRSADGRYNAILTTHVGGGRASTPMAMMYFRDCMKANEMKLHGTVLKVAVTFSPDNTNSDGMCETNKGLHEAIEAYNKQFGTEFGLDTVQEYNEDVSMRLRQLDPDGNNLDLVIVVDRLLTGFDAPCLNTLYVDRTLKGPGLVQAYSRTNRISSRNYKQFGQVVNFRWPRQNEKLMNDALAVYSDKKNAGKTAGEQQRILVDDNILAGTFEEELDEAKRMVKEIREKTGDFTQIPASEQEQDHIYGVMQRFNRKVALLKQYPMAMNDAKEPIPDSGYDYNDPEKLVVMLGLKSGENQMLTALTNEMKTLMARKQHIPVTDIDLMAELRKDVMVNYDYLTKLLEDLMNQVHDEKEEEIEKTREEIIKFANTLEDIPQAKQIIAAAKAIIRKEYPPRNSGMTYPYQLTNSLDVVSDVNRITVRKRILDFRNKWGITDVVSYQELMDLMKHHGYEKQDLDMAGQLTNILKEGAQNYQVMAEDPAIRSLSRLKYRNGLRAAVYALADSLTEEGRSLEE